MYYIKLNNGTEIPCIGLGSGSKTMQWPEYRPFRRTLLGRVANHYLNEWHDWNMCKKVVASFEHSL